MFFKVASVLIQGVRYLQIDKLVKPFECELDKDTNFGPNKNYLKKC